MFFERKNNLENNLYKKFICKFKKKSDFLYKFDFFNEL